MRDIIDNGRDIFSDIKGVTEQEFISSNLLRDAILYRLLRISEAAKKLGENAEALIPGQPWPQIRAFGNALRHDYDAIRYEEVWTILIRDLPNLVAACEKALEGRTDGVESDF
ncbi:MAG: DUF86 domain-containing protein [Rhizobiaceae bacterium]|nr:DUF86 domain-containing protein [Rhizobiaceae bacterium]MCV0406568.1 DUF86 domain-containing protein [Rhizobiaceae bacterium]